MTERSFDAPLQLVADRRRRQALHHLRHEASGDITIDDLVDRLLSDESRTDGEPTDREHLAIRLYHADLPKLADHGVVEFDPETRTVRYQADEDTERVLDSLPDEPSLARP